ncbi:MAG: cytosine deaminase [Burkholderiaceae bacterium]
MLLTNARLPEQEGLWQLAVHEGVIASITPQTGRDSPTTATGPADVLDAQGGLIIPPFVEPHIHLDTTQTAGQPEWNRSGTLFEGIERWAQRKAQLSIDDVKTRAWKTLRWQMANGVQHVRTHVDVSDPTLTALKAMLEVRTEIASWLDLQIVAFPQEGVLSYPNGPALLEEALRLGADVVGAIPHFEFTRELGVESLHTIMELAMRYDRPVDVHCDETDDEQSRFLETLAYLAHRDGLGSRVTASHTTAMHSYNGAYTSRLMRLLSLSGINFVANPLVNIHLQGRFDTYPKRRGMTRVPELLDAGLNVCFGHDDVFDPWYPLGTGNMLQVLHMGMHVTQMMGYDQLNSSLNLITRNSARTLGLKDYGIQTGHPANLLVLPAENGFDALRRQVRPSHSLRRGKLLAHTPPATTELYLHQPEPVNFR